MNELENKKEDNTMFYVVDESGQYINEFTSRTAADKYCEKWNREYRFNEWSEPMAHVVEVE